MSLITIQSFSDSYEANISKGKLASEGIYSFIQNEAFLAARPLLVNAVGGFQLQVKEEDAKKALKILQDK